MSSERIPVGLIGCGWISEILHIPNLLATPRAEFAALADPSDERRARAMRRAPGARAFRDAERMLADPDIGAVVIATPPAAGAALAAAALRAGKHVYLEKPGAESVAAIRAVRDAWLDSGRSLAIGYNFRRNAAVEGALAAVRAGRIGEPVAMQSVFTWAPGEGGGWRSAPGSGGALADLASHHIDLAFLFAGAPLLEASATLRALARPDDTADVALRFESGMTASIHVSWAEGRNANALRLCGREAHLDVDLVRAGPVRVLHGDPPRGRFARLRERIALFDAAGLVASGAERSFARLLDDWLASCLDGTPRAPSVDDAANVLRALEKGRALEVD